MRTGWHRFWYLFWRSVGSMAFFTYHNSLAWSHNAYKKSGGRRARREYKLAIRIKDLWRRFTNKLV